MAVQADDVPLLQACQHTFTLMLKQLSEPILVSQTLLQRLGKQAVGCRHQLVRKPGHSVLKVAWGK